MRSLVSLTWLFISRSCLTCPSQTDAQSQLCAECSLLTRLSLRSGWIGQLPHFYAMEYNSVTSKLILMAKEENLIAARELIAHSIRFSLKHIVELDGVTINLIPIPSRKAANRKRGFIHTQELGFCIINSELTDNSYRITPILEISGKLKDQSGLSARQRRQNIAMKVRVKAKAALPSGSSVNILFDDLVTTGETVMEAARALQAENLPLWGVISSCAT